MLDKKREDKFAVGPCLCDGQGIVRTQKNSGSVCPLFHCVINAARLRYTPEVNTDRMQEWRAVGLLEASFGSTVARSTDCDGPVGDDVQQLLKSVNFVASINTDHERVAREQQTHSHFIPPPSSVVSLSTEWNEHVLVVPIRDNVHQLKPKGVVCPTQFRLTTEQAESFRFLKTIFKQESMLVACLLSFIL